MALFQPSNAQKYTPKTIKFFDLYKHTTGSKQPSGSVQESARKALTNAGIDAATINKIIYENQAVPVSVMQNVASQLNQRQVFGFYNDPQTKLKDYLRKEMVKNMNVSRVRKEHMLEQRSDALYALEHKEDLGKINTGSKSGLNRPGNAPRPTPRYRLPY